MKIAFVGTYPPRQCGIGTFTNNLLKSVAANLPEEEFESSTSVIAINDTEEGYDYPREVKYVINQNALIDYIHAANYINIHNSKACVIEHEFGIFGGEDGVYILPFIHRLQVPLIVTFHTVLKEPRFMQKIIVQQLAEKAEKVVVMSQRAVRFLHQIYDVPENKIRVIEHGVPDFPAVNQQEMKKKFNFSGRKVILTFGLLSRNKGIETVLYALPEVVKKHPNTLYLILGSTHPNVLRHSGESYRNHLKMLVHQLGLENHVYFNNQFVSEQQLFEYLNAADIYVTPYLNEAQITSGTLSYAIGAGAAVVSTPYWHAQELLSDNRGRLFDFKDSQKLSEIIIELFDNPDLLQELRHNAYEYGKKLRWPKIGKQYLDLIEEVHQSFNYEIRIRKFPIDPQIMPTYNPEHIFRLTDDTGIIQHAKYGIPNLKEGYCLDDNARALLFCLLAIRQRKDKNIEKLLPIYLSYIHYMQNPDGSFRNFLSFSRQFLDKRGSDDSFGRAIWAIGFLIKFPPNDSYKQTGLEIFKKSIPYFSKLTAPRGIANTIIGISYYLKVHPEDEKIMNILMELADKLVALYKKHKDDTWEWFEDYLTYDNGIMPMALIHAGEVTNNSEYLEIGKITLEFLTSINFNNEYYAPVGNQGWYMRGQQNAQFDQQATDTMISVLMYYQAHQVLKKKKYFELIFKTYLWFLGENALRLPLYDDETHGCCDGLQETGLNRNQGAESTLAYWISHLTVLLALEREYEYIKDL